MKKLLILGDYYNIPGIIQTCKEEGIYTIVSDYHPPEISTSKYLADEYWMTSILDIDTLEKQCRENQVTGIYSNIFDYAGDAAVKLCERLGIKYYTSEFTRNFERSKDAFKNMCSECGLKVIPDYSNQINDPEGIKLPVVVKPIDSSGNRGQTVCYKTEEIRPAIEYAKTFSETKNVLVEKYLQGDELFAVYAINNGQIALSLLCGVYVNEGEPKRCYSVTCNRTKHLKRYLETVNDKVVLMLHKMGCRIGTAFVSCVAEDDDFYFMEMGHRLPGGMLQIGYKEMTGLDYSKLYLDYTLFGSSDFPIVPYDRETDGIACSYILWTRDGVINRIDGQEALKEDRISVFAMRQPGSQMGSKNWVNGPEYIVCFAAKNNQDFLRKMQKINDTLVCEDADGNDLLIRFNNFEKVFEKG